jgi:hypothetical protein
MAAVLAIYTHKRLAALAAFAVLALALAGCVVIKGPVQTSQQNVLGPVRVAFTICASSSNTSTHPGCDDQGNSNGAASTPSRGQVLVAFRVPDGATGPNGFATTSGVALTFTRSATYEHQLQDFLPAPSGQHWLGYISNGHTHDEGADGTPAEEATISVDFALPKEADNYPFPGPFRVRPVVGARSSSDETADARPVSCGNSVFGENSPFVSTDCIDSPSESDTATNLAQATRDLGIVGAAGVGSTGKSAGVPFNAKYVGAATPGASFTLSATTDLPGATGTPSTTTLTPGSNSDNNVSVAVNVPKKAKAGSYKVTLTAKAADGEVRSGTSNLAVHDKLAPVARSLKLSPSTFHPLASPSSIAKVKRRTRVSYRLSEAAKVKFRVQRCTKLKGKKCRRYKTAKGSFTHTGKAGANRFRFTGYVGGKRLRRGSYRLVGVPTDKSKNKGKSVRAAFRIR